MNLGNILNSTTNAKDQYVSESQVRGESGKAVSALQEGSKVTGTVVEVRNDRILLSIDGQNINAKIDSQISLKEGQNVTFSVKSNQNGQPMLTPLYENVKSSSFAQDALQNAGLSENEQNLKMVQEMIENGLSIRKDDLLSMYQSVKEVGFDNLGQAIGLTKMGLEITPQNCIQYTNYQNLTHALSNGIREIIGQLPEVLESLSQSENLSEALALQKELLDLFLPKEESNVSNENAGVPMEILPEEVPQKEILLKEAEGKTTVGMNAGQMEESLQKASQNETDKLAKAVEEMAEKTGLQEAGSRSETSKAGLLESQRSQSKESQTQTSNIENMQEKTRPDVTKELFSTEFGDAFARETEEKESLEKISQDTFTFAKESTLENATEFGMLSEILSKEELGQFEKWLQSINENTSENIRNLNSESALAEVRHVLEGMENGKNSQACSFFSGKIYQKLWKDMMENHWLIQPKEGLKKEDITRLYEHLEEHISKLETMLQKIEGKTSGFSESVENLRQNLDFLNQINHMASYVQIPLKQGEKYGNGELYVYTNKKNLARKDGNISALLHLSMEYLGNIDVYVQMKQEKVSTRFYLESEESIELLEKNLPHLTERLKQKGWNAQVKVSPKESMREDGIMDVMSQVLQKEEKISFGQIGFDVKA